MIIADTNIISSLARVGGVPYLLQLIDEPKLYVTPATYHELRKAVKVGCGFLEVVLAEIKLGNVIDVVQMTRQEVIGTSDLPDSLGAGEAESIAVCRLREGVRFLTNDRRARNFCRQKGIACLDLPAILRALWIRRVISKSEVRQLLERIETEQGMFIQNKDAIFAAKTSKRQRRRRRRRR